MAAEILTGNWDHALEEMQKLREIIDQKVKRRHATKDGKSKTILSIALHRYRTSLHHSTNSNNAHGSFTGHYLSSSTIQKVVMASSICSCPLNISTLSKPHVPGPSATSPPLSLSTADVKAK
jgi:hypothetical protein